MPRACPACGRPNADEARRCLYCTEPLEPLPSEDARDETPSEPEFPQSERHLIILAPQKDAALTEGRVETFAEAMGWTLYDARLALQAERHRLIRKTGGADEARELGSRLEDLGFDYSCFSEAEVEAIPVETVGWLLMDRNDVELGLGDKGTIRVAYSDLLILVRGEIARERHIERRMATPRGASRSLTPGLRLHIYGTEASVAAELDSEKFDWDVLGDHRSASTPINFKRLVEQMLERAPGAELDRGFDLEPAVLSHSKADSNVDSLLKGQPTGEGVIYDNEAQFRFYARWRYLIARAEAVNR